MQPYKFKVKYLTGGQNIADPLSRFSQTEGPVKSSLAHKISDNFVKFVAVTATPKAMTTREIEKASAEDEELIELRACTDERGWKGDKPISGELCAIGKLVLRGTRIAIPSKLRTQVLVLAHEGHPGIVSMKQKLIGQRYGGPASTDKPRGFAKPIIDASW